MDQASIDDIVSQIPIGQLAAQLGVDEETAAQAVRGAVPALLGGLAANAQDPGGAASLQSALAEHANDTIDLSSVDVAEGEKIVHHIYGDNTDEVVSRLGGLGGEGKGGGLMKMLLPLLAPLIMGWLAKKGAGNTQTTSPEDGTGGGLGGMLDSLGGGAPGGGGGGGLDDLLGGMTGGGSQGGGGGLGDLLGGLLGGGGEGGSSSGAPDIGDLLGGLLGGGTKS